MHATVVLSVKPHLVDHIPVLVSWKLNAPLAAIFVGFILPSRNDSFLNPIIRGTFEQRTFDIDSP